MRKDSLKLKWAKSPSEAFPLSGVVVVAELNEDGTKKRSGTCNVSFDDQEFRRIAKRMPRGISPQDPAYLQVEKYKDMYGIFCVYVSREVDGVVELYITSNRPEWLRGVKYNAKSCKTKKI